MSPRRLVEQPPRTVQDLLRRTWVTVGTQVHERRDARGWSVADLAQRAGLSKWVVYLVERGQPISIDAVARLAEALGVRLELGLFDRKRSVQSVRWADAVHSAMGELEARHLRTFGFGIAVDEPYQHFQFAGRADLVAWDTGRRALLHLENRTRFPDLQEMAGSFNAKRAYLGPVLAERLGLPGWRSETHVLVAAWSAEVLHALRLRAATFQALAPDGEGPFEGWWQGAPPSSGRHACLVVLDPVASGRQRLWIGLEAALGARPRHAGYAALAQRLRHAA
ncbi:MAG: helix-turn-helix transcriptional regulator [Chloroflexi bacterium]|nr:helix-turn-helix transcriptional regulator [Chloroflexota bacterium]